MVQPSAVLTRSTVQPAAAPSSLRDTGSVLVLCSYDQHITRNDARLTPGLEYRATTNIYQEYLANYLAIPPEKLVILYSQ